MNLEHFEQATWSQLAMLHSLYKLGSFWPAEDSLYISQACPEANPTNPDASSKALGAFHKLICVLGTLPI